MKQPKRPSPFITRSSRVVWSCPWYSVRQDEITLPNGRPGVFNVVQHPGAVWIIPLTAAGEIVMLRHYRYTIDDWCWEVPAGGLKAGLSVEETALAELREEVGGRAEWLEYFGRFYTANGICNEVAQIYIAGGVTLGQTDHEAAEVIEVHPLPLDQVLSMAHANQISDAPTALALLLAEPRLRQLAAT
jgi:8-oxo-dGTP pyrophosphatase MutT (NUDIX family)